MEAFVIVLYGSVILFLGLGGYQILTGIITVKFYRRYVLDKITFSDSEKLPTGIMLMVRPEFGIILSLIITILLCFFAFIIESAYLEILLIFIGCISYLFLNIFLNIFFCKYNVPGIFIFFLVHVVIPIFVGLLSWVFKDVSFEVIGFKYILLYSIILTMVWMIGVGMGLGILSYLDKRILAMVQNEKLSLSK